MGSFTLSFTSIDSSETMIITCWALLFVQLLSFTGASDSSIINGKESKPHSRPYMVSLQVRSDHVCGGILIHKKFVLTAAHCKNDGMTAVLGAHNISKSENQQRINVVKFIPHPKFQYTKPQYDYDIMLLELKHEAKLKKGVKTIGLPKNDQKVKAKIKCTVAGWGITAENASKGSQVLKEAIEETLPNKECNNTWQQLFDETHMNCTKFDKNKGGFCQGDSGGPLICKNKPVGLIAFTAENMCNNDTYPHVFMNIPYFVPWIKTVMKSF